MEEIVVSKECKTLTAHYAPVMIDVDIDTLTLHPEQLDDPEYGKEMLAGSLEEFGQGRPIYCVKAVEGTLQVIEGSRIWRAAQHSGWKSVTVIILTKIEPEDVLPLMYALKSHQRKFNYTLMAEKFQAVKDYAQKFIRESNVENNEGSNLTTRKYMQSVFGFDNERYVSDFENILKSPEKDYILAQLDSGMWKFGKAAKRAAGKAAAPKPDMNSHKTKPDVFACSDCPRQKAFLEKLANDATANDIGDLKTEED